MPSPTPCRPSAGAAAATRGAEYSQEDRRMSRDASNEMLSLLKELSVYKSLNEEYMAGARGRLESEAYEDRERRRQEIKQEMHNLAAESKNDRA